MKQIIRELKRQVAGEKLEPEQLKGLIRAGYVYRNGEEHHLTDMGRNAPGSAWRLPGRGCPSGSGIKCTVQELSPAGDRVSEINSSVEWAASLEPV
jgi:hypothetical protein